MSKREHVYELVDNSKNGKVVAEFWWNGSRVMCDNMDLLERIREASFKATPKQVIAFLENLPNV